MRAMYADEAQSHYCPFSLPVKMYCLTENCLSWELAAYTHGEGGYCSRLSRRRTVAVLGTVETYKVDYPILAVDIDDDGLEVPQ